MELRYASSQCAEAKFARRIDRGHTRSDGCVRLGVAAIRNNSHSRGAVHSERRNWSIISVRGRLQDCAARSCLSFPDRHRCDGGFLSRESRIAPSDQVADHNGSALWRPCLSVHELRGPSSFGHHTKGHSYAFVARDSRADYHVLRGTAHRSDRSPVFGGAVISVIYFTQVFVLEDREFMQAMVAAVAAGKSATRSAGRARRLLC